MNEAYKRRHKHTNDARDIGGRCGKSMVQKKVASDLVIRLTLM